MPRPGTRFCLPEAALISLAMLGAPRLHRLPQRLDYTLIPAPLGMLKRESPNNLDHSLNFRK